MSIKASELPELIAAAVKKAVAEKQITDEQLLALAHRPITIGLIAQPELTAAKSGATITEGERVPFPLRTMGYRLVGLDELRNTAALKAEEE